MFKEEQEVSRNNWLATLLATAFVFLALGYIWRYAQEKGQYEHGFEEGLNEMSVTWKDEVCK